MAQGIYLDNSMTARPSAKAISKMLPFLTDMWGLPSAPHQMGQELFPAIHESFKAIYELVGVSEDANFVFTSSGAEAVNHAIFATYMDVTRSTGKNVFITSLIEEAPALMSINRLEQLGCISKTVAPDKKGRITAEALADAITPRTAMISLSWANGLTGIVHPVSEIAALCQERGIKLHLDATHVLGKLFYELSTINPDFISFNGDQLHAPQGTGGLYIKAHTPCSSFILGGLEQAGQRAGSYNIGALAALGQAAQEALENRDFLCTEIARLRDKLEKGISEEIPESVIFFRDQERLPHCTTIAFPGIVNEAMLYAMNRKNLFACIGGGSFQQVRLILSASGVPNSLAQTAITFSLSRTTSEDEIDRAIVIIGDIARRLRSVSHHLEDK